jgi:ectoine hydroxylase-related dioxygenase (phytanoyl-CoA dioxygenase family)
VTTGPIEEALERAGVTERTLAPQQREALDRDGYVVLRGVYDAPQVARLREAFERKFVPSHLWPMPRGHDTRHSMLDDEPEAQRACLAPPILACVHHILRRRFFLADVQGRNPLPGGGQQRLHRDWVVPAGPAPIVIALAFLDPYGPANGATRVLPGTHLLDGGADVYRDAGPLHPDQVVVEGDAGDVLVMNGYLAHSGTHNTTNEKRRNLQIGYRGFELHREYVEKRDLALPEMRYWLGQEE